MLGVIVARRVLPTVHATEVGEASDHRGSPRTHAEGQTERTSAVKVREASATRSRISVNACCMRAGRFHSDPPIPPEDETAQRLLTTLVHPLAQQVLSRDEVKSTGVVYEGDSSWWG